MVGRGQYGKSKRDGEAVLEGDQWMAEGKEKSDTMRCVRGIFVFDQGVFFLGEVSGR